MARPGNSCRDADDITGGALHILGASLMFALMGALVKLLAGDMANNMIVFLRNLFALLIMLPLMHRNAAPDIRTEKIHLHLLRTAAGLSAMYCYFYALAHMKLAEAVLLSYTSPLFIPIIARLWLKERVSLLLNAAILTGFCGVVLILRPGLGIFRPMALAGLSAGVLASVAMVTIRKLSATEPPDRIVFYYTLLCTLISACPAVVAWQPVSPRSLLITMIIGVVAVAGQLLMTRGYKMAPAVQVGPFIYSVVVFAAAFGWLFWGETLDVLTVAGGALICLAGVMVTLVSAEKGRDRT